MKGKETAPRFMPPVLELHVVRRPFLPQNNPWISIFRPKIGELAVETLPANLSENSGFYSSANVETCLGANRLSRRSSAYNIKDCLAKCNPDTMVVKNCDRVFPLLCKHQNI